MLAGRRAEVAEALTHRGHHSNGLRADCVQRGLCSYNPAREQRVHRWTDKPAEQERVFLADWRQVRGARGRRLGRKAHE